MSEKRDEWAEFLASAPYVSPLGYYIRQVVNTAVVATNGAMCGRAVMEGRLVWASVFGVLTLVVTAWLVLVSRIYEYQRRTLEEAEDG